MSHKTWRLITDPPQSAALNMATDEAIATAFSEGKAPETLRLYRWEKPSFSIGTFQTLETDWIALLRAEDIDIVRRMTGGRGLLHDDELTYSVVSSTTHPLFSGGIRGTFQNIGNALIRSLDQLAIEARVHAPSLAMPSQGKNPLCFDAVSAYEITAQGKKLIGSAQRRWKKHFLQHGGLILKNNLGTSPLEAIRHKLVSKNQITLADLMDRLPTNETLVQTLKIGFEDALSIVLKSGTLSPYEENLRQAFLHKKYNRPAWNLYRDKTKMP